MKSWILRKLAVRQNVRMGKNFHVGPGSVISAPKSLQIGDSVYVGKYVTIQVDGRIGTGCLIANNVGIVVRTDHDLRAIGHLIRNAPWVGESPRELSKPLVIEEDVWIGFGAVVLSGIHIGASCVIAAGSVVVSDQPAGAVVAGNPARPVGSRFDSADDLRKHWRLLGISPRGSMEI